MIKLLKSIGYLLVGVLVGTLLSLLFTGCGIESDLQDKSCYEVYDNAFCDSIKGKDGQNGENGEEGIDGRIGDTGEAGSDGIDGMDGRHGESCTATKEEETTIITCGGIIVSYINDGEDGERGISGSDGQNGQDAIIEVIDPCGDETEFDEVLFRLTDKHIYGIISIKKVEFLAEFVAGEYITKDGTDCKYKITDDLEVLW